MRQHTQRRLKQSTIFHRVARTSHRMERAQSWSPAGLIAVARSHATTESCVDELRSAHEMMLMTHGQFGGLAPQAQKDEVDTERIASDERQMDMMITCNRSERAHMAVSSMQKLLDQMIEIQLNEGQILRREIVSLRDAVQIERDARVDQEQMTQQAESALCDLVSDCAIAGVVGQRDSQLVRWLNPEMMRLHTSVQDLRAELDKIREEFRLVNRDMDKLDDSIRTGFAGAVAHAEQCELWKY